MTLWINIGYLHFAAGKYNNYYFHGKINESKLRSFCLSNVNSYYFQFRNNRNL